MAQDLTGQKFGRLTVIKQSGTKNNRTIWKCQCDCGKELDIVRAYLTRGQKKSCGCLQVEAITKHGYKNTPTYNSWIAMKQRCNNPNNDRYNSYGARGISVCLEWLNDFSQFLNDMGEKPEGLTLERIDTEGNYCKENCIWASHTRQSINKRSNPNNTSGHKGVSWSKQKNKWVAYISVNNKRKHLGYFTELQDAIDCRLKAEELYFKPILKL